MLNLPRKAARRGILLVLAFLAITAGCAGFERQSKPAALPEIRQGSLAGYLPPAARPDSLPTSSPARSRLRCPDRGRGQPQGPRSAGYATLDAGDRGQRPPVSACSRHVQLCTERSDHGGRDAASLHVAAPQPYRCIPFHLRSQGPLQACTTVFYREQGTHLHARCGKGEIT